uniref:RRM domain-containing protein n=1 Tax=Aegilops tauschii subsp. strangulata TaxID=200361 RepID=A0A452YWR7_AEGTS
PAVDPVELARREDKRKAADVKRELDEFFAAKKSGVSGSASTPAHGDKKGGTPENGPKTDKGKILKVSWEGGADYYTAAKLDEIFKQFGTVEDIVIKTRKSKSKGSAIIVMASKEAANQEGHRQGQLKHLNRGQVTLMELGSAIWKHRYSENFKRPRKGRNLDN